MADLFRYISFGAGVQSTALLVCSALGLRDVPRADIAIFADTCAEPQWVYSNSAWYKLWAESLPRPLFVTVARTRNGLTKNLENAVEKGSRFASIPAFTRGSDGRPAMTRRQCTREFKIEAIERKVRTILGAAPGRRCPQNAISMQGISLDEAWRMKPNQTAWVTNEWPLIDARMRRQDCARLLTDLHLPLPKKSSCVYCPYHSDEYWRDLRDNHLAEFEEACRVDEKIRDMSIKGMRGKQFVHRSLVPLREAKFRHEDQLDMFNNECEGYCGV